VLHQSKYVARMARDVFAQPGLYAGGRGCRAAGTVRGERMKRAPRYARYFGQYQATHTPVLRVHWQIHDPRLHTHTLDDGDDGTGWRIHVADLHLPSLPHGTNHLLSGHVDP
jgi:hypothetical protein